MVGGRSSGAGTQLLRFGSKCLYLVGHLADTGLLLLNCVAKQVPKRVLCNAVHLKALDREGRRVRGKKKKKKSAPDWNRESQKLTCCEKSL